MTSSPCRTRACDFPSENPPAETAHPFARAASPLPLKRRHYNGDIRLGAYKAGALHFAGRQRKGTHEPLDSCVGRTHRAWCALKEDFPLSPETPLPSETIRAIELIRSTPDTQICKIWDAQLRAAEELGRTCGLAQTKWNARMPGSISGAAGEFQTVAVKQLLHQLNIGGAAWIDKFAYGFPIAGPMSRKFPFPRGGGICSSSYERDLRVLVGSFPGTDREIRSEECRPAAGRVV